MLRKAAVGCAPRLTRRRRCEITRRPARVSGPSTPASSRPFLEVPTRAGDDARRTTCSFPISPCSSSWSSSGPRTPSCARGCSRRSAAILDERERTAATATDALVEGAREREGDARVDRPPPHGDAARGARRPPGLPQRGERDAAGAPRRGPREGPPRRLRGPGEARRRGRRSARGARDERPHDGGRDRLPRARAEARVSAAALLLLAEEGHEAAKGFLGVPTLVWQVVNLAAFLGLLWYFLKKPVAEFFGNREDRGRPVALEGRRRSRGAPSPSRPSSASASRRSRPKLVEPQGKREPRCRGRARRPPEADRRGRGAVPLARGDRRR